MCKESRLTQLNPPSMEDKTKNKLGVCFSGGGTRAMVAGMGQLRALTELNLIKDIGRISAVSGGSWVSSIYTFRDEKYKDDIILGKHEEPENLVLNSDQKTSKNLSHVDLRNIGNIAVKTSLVKAASAILLLIKKHGYDLNKVWARLVGQLILSPYDLNSLDSEGKPNMYIGSKKELTEGNVGGVPLSKFLLIPDNRPLLTINTAMFPNYLRKPYELVPFQIEGNYSGIDTDLQQPIRTGIGGGFVDAYALASMNPKEYNCSDSTVMVDLGNFGLSDATGLSSAFFATILTPYIKAIVKQPNTLHGFDISNKVKSKLIDWLKEKEANSIQKVASLKENLRTKGLVPSYPYWSVKDAFEEKAEENSYKFADGGNLENLGITPLIKYGYKEILSFINTATPLKQIDGKISVSDDLAAFFGYTPLVKMEGDSEHRYYKYSELTEEQFNSLGKATRPYYNNQIFDSSKFQEVLEGLFNANQGDTAEASFPSVFKQNLVTVRNTKFNIKRGIDVSVTWFYLTPASNWTSRLDNEIQTVISQEYQNFPNYETVSDFQQTPEQVNLLANFAGWMVKSTLADHT